VNQAAVQRRLQQFETLCRQRGLPLTVQRRDIFQAVLQSDDHPSADQVYDVVKDRIAGLSRTTVYRVLDTLVQLGVVRRLHHPGAAVRFDGRVDRHHHLVCRLCDQVVDVTGRDLDRLKPPRQRGGFLVEDYTIQFVGVCAACREETEA